VPLQHQTFVMNRALLFLLFPILFALLACGPGTDAGQGTPETAKSAVTNIYLSRHAEKAGGENPGLLPAGEDRAERLARKLRGNKVAAVYATGYRRTQATAAPVAQANGLSVRTYDAGATAARLTEGWVARHRGETIFVVGHSNTVPALVNALIGEKRFKDIDENNYDRLFKVTVGADGRGEVTELSSGG